MSDETLAEVQKERDNLAGLLWGLLYDMHPTTGSTSRSGGFGGQAITAHCDVVRYYEDWQLYFMDRVHAALGVVFRRDDRDGTTRLGDALKAAKAVPDTEGDR